MSSLRPAFLMNGVLYTRVIDVFENLGNQTSNISPRYLGIGCPIEVSLKFVPHRGPNYLRATIVFLDLNCPAASVIQTLRA